MIKELPRRTGMLPITMLLLAWIVTAHDNESRSRKDIQERGVEFNLQHSSEGPILRLNVRCNR